MGMALASAVLPLVTVDDSGQTPYPPLPQVIPWGRVTLTAVATALAISAVVLALAPAAGPGGPGAGAAGGGGPLSRGAGRTGEAGQ